MSVSPQRGRRRAETVRRPSVLASATVGKSGRGTAGKSVRGTGKFAATTAVKSMATVAVVGALVAAGAVTQAMENSDSGQNGSSLLTAAGHNSSAISAPTNAPIEFPNAEVSSTPSASPSTAAAKALAADVEPVTAPSTAPSSPSAAPSKAPAPVVVDDPAGAQAYAAGELAARGWGPGEMSCLTQLWNRESEWLTSAENPDGGAYGIAQSLPAEKMASVGSDWKTNYKTQITWGLGYIEERYGSPCAAWGHSNAVNWY